MAQGGWMAVACAGLAWSLGACAGRPSPLTTGPAGADFQEGAVMAVVTSALTGEAAGQRNDTLYAPGPRIVVNGRDQPTGYRFAGVGAGGQVVVTYSQLEIRAASSWGLVVYRWESPEGVTQEGQATFVLTMVAPGRWQIQHIHSSSPQ